MAIISAIHDAVCNFHPVRAVAEKISKSQTQHMVYDKVGRLREETGQVYDMSRHGLVLERDTAQGKVNEAKAKRARTKFNVLKKLYHGVQEQKNKTRVEVLDKFLQSDASKPDAARISQYKMQRAQAEEALQSRPWSNVSDPSIALSHHPY